MSKQVPQHKTALYLIEIKLLLLLSFTSNLKTITFIIYKVYSKSINFIQFIF